MKTYEKAKALLSGHPTKKLAGNTVARINNGGAVVIWFWDTDIIRVFLNGDVLVSNGGFKTATTKSRINWILGELGIKWGLSQERREWVWRKYLGKRGFSRPRPFGYRNTFDTNGKFLLT